MCKMKKIFTAAFVCILLAVSTLSISAFAVEDGDVVILYENDVHCSVEGYSKISAMKKELQENYILFVG